MNSFKIIVPFYNVEKTISKTVKSVTAQNYKNYECYFVDDMSTDQSLEILKKSAKNNKNIKIIQNQEKKFSLRNIYDTINQYTDDEDIIVILDGDDFLFGPNVLEKLNDYYLNNDCWLTYGSYVNLSNKRRGKFSEQIPEEIILKNAYRRYKWCTSHLRTFKSFLFKKINENDLKKDGRFFTITGDLAIMFPMLEMSGHRSHYIHEILYVWNDLSDLNDFKKDNRKQIMVENILRSMKPYEVIK